MTHITNLALALTVITLGVLLVIPSWPIAIAYIASVIWTTAVVVIHTRRNKITEEIQTEIAGILGIIHTIQDRLPEENVIEKMQTDLNTLKMALRR